jgi:hypothetical protein
MIILIKIVLLQPAFIERNKNEKRSENKYRLYIAIALANNKLFGFG